MRYIAAPQRSQGMLSLEAEALGFCAAVEVESPVWRGVMGFGAGLAPVGSDMPWIIER